MQVTKDGIKTRYFEDIVLEVSQALDIHADLGSRLGGIHIELTGDDVTECVGGPQGLTGADLNSITGSRSTPASTTSNRSNWRSSWPARCGAPGVRASWSWNAGHVVQASAWLQPVPFLCDRL